MVKVDSIEILNEHDAEDKFQDFLKGGGLDVDEMKASKEKKENDMIMKLKEKEIVEVIEEKKDTEPDENMKGYF